MLYDMLLIGALWALCIAGVLLPQRKKPAKRCNAERAVHGATRNTPKTTK